MSGRLLGVGRPRAALIRLNARPAAMLGRRLLSSAAMPEELVQVERRGAVAIVRLNRPEKLNALSLPMFRAIRAAAKSINSPKLSGVRAVVLCGAGRSFCAGLDVKSLMRDPLAMRRYPTMAELLETNAETGATLAQEVGYLWRLLPVPVIAAVHGVCLGGGFQIVLGADFRFAAADSKFSIMESKWGLVPDMGGTLALRELIPLDVAKELAMTARVLSAGEAHSLGLVTRVCASNPFDEALLFANELAARSPDCLAATKALLNANYGRGKAAEEKSALALEARLQRKLIGGWNQLAASAKGLGVPDILQPGFRARDNQWVDELRAEGHEERDATLAKP
ncbi:ClpP/crotonase-like domain-containing protein [Pavlovales sp. CCMP2436]|nr:ClpP/crotonase-like domain-containing protein [Pavlovales sp. CCMP2436]